MAKKNKPIHKPNTDPSSYAEQLLTIINRVMKTQASEELKQAIWSKTVIKTFSEGETFLSLGQTCKYCYFVLNGNIAVRSNGKKDKAGPTKWILSPGGFAISPQSFFQQIPSTETLEAISDAVCMAIHYDDLETLYNKFPEFNTAGRKLTEIYYLRLDVRYDSIKLTAQERYDMLKKTDPELVASLSNKELASYLDVHIITLARLKK